ncbi:MAG: CoA-binding protein, partial [Treponema sp.]|nr:CoA-binding protein [Treponema sp.]
YPANQMNWIIKQEGITLAVLTVEDKEAQTMTDRLVAAGVLGIVNMTRTVLKVPPSVKVENASIVNALKIIS